MALIRCLSTGVVVIVVRLVRAREILTLVGLGLSNDEIAEGWLSARPRQDARQPNHNARLATTRACQVCACPSRGTIATNAAIEERV